MNLWSVEHFLGIFVIPFGWVQQQSNNKPTQKWWQNEKSGQLVRVAFVKKYITSYKIHTLPLKNTVLLCTCSFTRRRRNTNNSIKLSLILIIKFNSSGVPLQCSYTYLGPTMRFFGIWVIQYLKKNYDLQGN